MHSHAPAAHESSLISSHNAADVPIRYRPMRNRERGRKPFSRKLWLNSSREKLASLLNHFFYLTDDWLFPCVRACADVGSILLMMNACLSTREAPKRGSFVRQIFAAAQQKACIWWWWHQTRGGSTEREFILHYRAHHNLKHYWDSFLFIFVFTNYFIK